MEQQFDAPQDELVLNKVLNRVRKTDASSLRASLKASSKEVRNRTKFGRAETESVIHPLHV